MQLGTRWDAGSTPPVVLPAEVLELLAQAEAELPAVEPGSYPPRWTLTWLERRPVLELDTGVGIRIGRDGRARLIGPDDIEDSSDEDLDGDSDHQH